MGREAAAVLDKNGETTSLQEDCQLVVYQRQQGRWRESRRMECRFDKSQGLKGLRRGMAEIIGFLADCKIVAGREITGVPYYELEKAQCSIWEISGTPTDFLDYILAKEEKERQKKAEASPIKLPSPVRLSEGKYSISLKDIQESSSGITSKQVLVPFLQQGKFSILTVTCAHVPPWLDCELRSGRFSGDIVKLGINHYEITLHNKKSAEKTV